MRSTPAAPETVPAAAPVRQVAAASPTSPGFSADAAACSGNKVQVCHRPPGNPTNRQQLCIATNALPAHLGHGDSLSSPEACDGVDNDCDGSVDEGGVCAASCPCNYASVAMTVANWTASATKAFGSTCLLYADNGTALWVSNFDGQNQCQIQVNGVVNQSSGGLTNSQLDACVDALDLYGVGLEAQPEISVTGATTACSL
jgi:hypothetical protein